MTPLPETVQAVFRSHSTVSGRIRALADAGYSRSDIAKLVDRSYQQVRNVLVEHERRTANRIPPTINPSPHPSPSGMAETSAAYVPQAPANVGPVLGWLDVEPDGVL